ncbi:MFS transporter [Tundrisphaera sp. TA3]|uniref:MFS transporter n=1 Tax=Tundrisphaera sp. TA3 TaxID=3435775 RepID=UPI003EB8529B
MDPNYREDFGDAAVKPPSRNDTLLFWACFMSIVATAFGFVVRTQIIDDWGRQFNLNETQKGDIFGVGLWPFSISIVLFSLIIDKIGYGTAMAFAFLCHVGSAILTIMTPQLAGGDPEKAFWLLYAGTFIVALGNGTVEAVANPVVANLFPREKTKYLNMLHAGWPGGLVLGGLIALSMGSFDWRYKVALLFLPAVGYAVLMLGRKFPVSERVTAGVSFKSMCREVGVLGAALIVGLIVRQLGTVFAWPDMIQLAIWAVLTIAYGAYVGFAPGQPMFLFLMIIMIPLATTELGTDSWMSSLMEPAMQEGLGISGAWVLVYTSLIMLILRFFAGPIVHKLSPLGLLSVSAAIAAIGLFSLSKASGLSILAAATLYGFGKSFFWPTMLGVAAEQFPKGGALTLNTLGGVGMLAVGVLGAPFLGSIQDSKTDIDLLAREPALHAQVIDNTPKFSVFGKYKALDTKKVDALPAEPKKLVNEIKDGARKNALAVVSILPCIMLVCYLILIGYFRTKGGYKPQILISEKEEALLMTGGAVGPADL